MRQFVRKLRKEQTDAERKLWASLRDRQLLGFKFRRQHEIGPYIADFCCPQRKLMIELDGGQHNEQVLRDRKRTDYLNQMGYRVLRFWDHEVLQESESVLEAIRLALSDPHPTPLPRRERGRREFLISSPTVSRASAGGEEILQTNQSTSDAHADD